MERPACEPRVRSPALPKEHLIGSIRSKCLDHLIVFGEAHPRLILTAHFVLQRGPDASVIELKIVQIFGGRRGSATSQRYQS